VDITCIEPRPPPFLERRVPGLARLRLPEGQAFGGGSLWIERLGGA
jgi:hypothetical protein